MKTLNTTRGPSLWLNFDPYVMISMDRAMNISRMMGFNPSDEAVKTAYPYGSHQWGTNYFK